MQNQECQSDFPIDSHQLGWKSGGRMIHAVGRFSQASLPADENYRSRE